LDCHHIIDIFQNRKLGELLKNNYNSLVEHPRRTAQPMNQKV